MYGLMFGKSCFMDCFKQSIIPFTSIFFLQLHQKLLSYQETIWIRKEDQRESDFFNKIEGQVIQFSSNQIYCSSTYHKTHKGKTTITHFFLRFVLNDAGFNARNSLVCTFIHSFIQNIHGHCYKYQSGSINKQCAFIFTYCKFYSPHFLRFQPQNKAKKRKNCEKKQISISKYVAKHPFLV